MRGHQPLIAMRMRGRCPEAAFLHVGLDHSGMPDVWPLMPAGGRWGDLTPDIEIPPRDRLSSLDLRFLVGMVAMVSGDDEARTIRVAEMCQEAGCRRCFVVVHDPKTHAVISSFFYTEEVPPWQEF